MIFNVQLFVILLSNLKTMNIRPIEKSKLCTVDFENLDFGSIFSDYMFVCDYANGSWGEPEIVPYAPLQLDPSASALHYGQAIFEGMKAYKDDKGDVFLFRPDQNIKRLNKSAGCGDSSFRKIVIEGLQTHRFRKRLGSAWYRQFTIRQTLCLP